MTALTLLMPLKGRHLHTLRFFWHANRQSLPFRIVVADGQVEPGIATRLARPHALFPALDIDYIRCPDDVSYQRYFDKLVAAVASVTTPYVMLCDNDDFVVQAGVKSCMAFLDDHPDYAGVSGGIAGFALHPDPALPNVAGTIRSFGSMYHDGYRAETYDAPQLAARVTANFVRGYSLYYSVFRTEILAAVLGEIADIGFTDLKAVETFFGARVKTLGHCRLDRRIISYVRQSGTSSGAPDIWTLDDLRGAGPRAAEVQRCLTALARPIASADGTDERIVCDVLRDRFIAKLTLEAQAKAEAAATQHHRRRDSLLAAARSVMPRGAVELRRRFLRQRARDEIAASMRTHGASHDDVLCVRREIDAIERTLEGPDFPAFLRTHASDLLPHNAGAGIAMAAG